MDKTTVFFELDEEKNAGKSAMSDIMGDNYWIVTLKTIPGVNEDGEGEAKIYPENKCELRFKSSYKAAEGLNLLFL